MDRKKKIFFAIFTWLVLGVAAETLARVGYCFASRSLKPLAYGVGVKIESISPRISFSWISDSHSSAPEIRGEEITHAANGAKIIACFGGSTTAGNDCSEDASSWPELLQLKLASYNVENFGSKGTNSDYAVNKFRSLIASERRIHVGIFANWINEMDVLTIGFGLNKQFFLDKYPGEVARIESNKLSYIQVLLLRIDKTLRHKSLFYYFISKNLIKFRETTLNRQQEFELKRTPMDLVMAVENYKLNLEQLFLLCNKNNIQMVILRPPINWQSYEERFQGEDFLNWVRNWDMAMMRAAQEFSKRNNVRFVDAQVAYGGNKYESMFCDGVHQTFEGHRIMADWLSQNLLISE